MRNHVASPIDRRNHNRINAITWRIQELHKSGQLSDSLSESLFTAIAMIADMTGERTSDYIRMRAKFHREVTAGVR